MKPPALAEMLVAAVAPLGEYEIVTGDLHEEYLRVRNVHGETSANRWYWIQTLRSVPSLLSYSKSRDSLFRQLGVSLIALGVLVAMLAASVITQALVHAPIDLLACICAAQAIVFGAILSWLVRSDGIRVAFFSSIFLVVCFVLPAIAGNPDSQAPLLSWVVLFAAVPLMCIGAAGHQITQRTETNSN